MSEAIRIVYIAAALLTWLLAGRLRAAVDAHVDRLQTLDEALSRVATKLRAKEPVDAPVRVPALPLAKPQMGFASGKVILRALENTKRWGRSALPEDETNDDLELVHDTDLFHAGLTEEVPASSNRGEVGDPPMRLTRRGQDLLATLARSK